MTDYEKNEGLAKDVTQAAYEAAISMAERTIRRLFAVVVLLILLLVGTNVAWLVYENSFEDTMVYQLNEEGYNNYIGNDGDINNYRPIE